MPPSDCGVVHQIAEFAIQYANFSSFQNAFLRTRFFQKSPPIAGFGNVLTTYMWCRCVALRSKQTNEVPMDRLAYTLPEAAALLASVALESSRRHASRN
jgi:hypothetical protein